MYSEWILQHGWGFTSNMWDIWKKFVPEQVKLHPLDRGYFKQALITDEFSQFTYDKVLVVHSFGLHLAPERLMSQADFICIISGFKQFDKKNSLQLMKKRLQTEPKDVLSSFYKKNLDKITYPIPIPASIDSQLLYDDLKCLETSDLDISIIREKKILILHGANDAIVPLQKGEELHKLLPNSKMIVVEGGEHGLPISHASECCKMIEDWVESERTNHTRIL